MSTGHTTLSKLLSDAGFPDVAEAQGVVWAESSANAKTINHQPCDSHGNHAVGLMQVCMNHCGEFGLSNLTLKCLQQLQDPVTNLRVAKAIYDAAGGTFTKDWATAGPGGSSKRFVGKDATISYDTSGPLPSAVDSVGKFVADPGGIGSAVGNAVGGVGDFLGSLSDPSTYLRVGKGLLGGVFIVIGVGAVTFIIADKVNKSSGGLAGAAAVLA